MEAEEPLRPRTTWWGGVWRMTALSEDQRLRVTGMSLADPAAAARVQPRVTVWAEVGGHEAAHVIGMLSSEQPIAPVLPPLELAGGGGEYVLRHDSAASSVRLYGYYLDPPPPNPDGEGEPTRRRFLVDIDAEELGGEDEEEAEVEYVYEALTEEDVVERYDSDNGEDGSDHRDCDDEDEEDEEEDEEVQPSNAGDVEEAAGGEISKRRKITP